MAEPVTGICPPWQSPTQATVLRKTIASWTRPGWRLMSSTTDSISNRVRAINHPFHHNNFHYNADEDYYVCPMGQHMTRVGTSHSKSASGYRSESARYLARNCKGCPLRCLCYKARGDRRAIEVNHRLNGYSDYVIRESNIIDQKMRHYSRSPFPTVRL